MSISQERRDAMNKNYEALDRMNATGWVIVQNEILIANADTCEGAYAIAGQNPDFDPSKDRLWVMVIKR